MGFQEDKRRILECMRQDRVVHELRLGQEAKNLLSTGEVTAEEAIRILEAVRGQHAEASVHHFDPEKSIWIYRPLVGGERWYLKVYLSGEDCVFLSFHRSEGGAG